MSTGVEVLIASIINIIGSILIYSAIPFIWYIISKKKVKEFLNYIGLYKPSKNHVHAIIIVISAYIVSFIIIYILNKQLNGMQTNPFLKIYNTETIGVFCVYTLLYGLQTGIGEEILFRGFIGKRLVSKFGFLVGNIVQSLIFAVPHVLTFSEAPILEFTLGMLNALFIGYVFGYITEKIYNGSIVPSIIAHALINISSGLLLIFVF
jgi:membrane protease YdiL (CAAX protease family)